MIRIKKHHQRIKIVLKEKEGKLIAEAPAIPGCSVVANNFKDLDEKMKTTITHWLEVYKDVSDTNADFPPESKRWYKYSKNKLIN